MAETITAVLSRENPDTVFLTIMEANGRGLQKRVAVEDFAKTLVESQVEAKLNRLGRPAYLYDMAYAKDGSYMVVQIVPPVKAVVNYKTLSFFIPFPALCFSTRVNSDGHITDSKVFALKEWENPTDETELYHYPFGNVYGDGRICWGGCNTLKNEYRAPGNLSGIPAEFFSAATNDDLWQKEYCKIEGVVPLLSSIYEDLAKREQFPLEVLADKGLKIADLFC